MSGEGITYCSRSILRNPTFLFVYSGKMRSWLLLMFVLHDVHTVSVGLIPYASLTLTSSSSSNTVNGTTQDCLCAMITSSTISALNYFSNNTCALFSNASLINANFSWTININVNSLLYIRYLPIRPKLCHVLYYSHSIRIYISPNLNSCYTGSRYVQRFLALLRVRMGVRAPFLHLQSHLYLRLCLI